MGMPRCRAISRPGALSRLLITTAISASSFRRAMLLSMASKVEPRPEIRTPRFTCRYFHAWPVDTTGGRKPVPVLVSLSIVGMGGLWGVVNFGVW